MDKPPLSYKQVASIVESGQKKIALWVGAVSAGKTIASLFAFLIAVKATRGAGLILIVGKTLQTIERNILDPLMDARLFGIFSRHVVHTKGSGTAVIMGRTVHLVGANDSRSEEKIRGSTVELAYVDEATLLPPGFWEMLISRLRVPGARLLATTNPGSTRHWLRLDWILQAAQKNMIVFHFTMDDNPSLTDDYITDMKASFAGVFYDRMIKGLWTNAEGAIYDMWDTTKHVIPWESLPPIQRVLCTAIDYGTQHATSAIMLGLGYDRRLYMMDELRIDVAVNSLRQSPSQQSKTVREWLKQPHHPEQHHLVPEWVVVDTAAADFRQELYVDGLATQGAKKDVAYGIGIVSSLLHKGLLLVTDRCTGWNAEVTDYVWDPKATERGVDEPLKVKDDSMDAGRYAVVTTESLWRGQLAEPALAA
ncbi:PBSX family phage terminase large subunit [Paenarthrobacter nicotinovorans]|uniref:PBSX family phage terminase large subunit n=1 Tax=Paenarthrobacter nicotinovorans TaxID=29320 RepID=UPI00383068E1